MDYYEKTNQTSHIFSNMLSQDKQSMMRKNFIMQLIFQSHLLTTVGHAFKEVRR